MLFFSGAKVVFIRGMNQRHPQSRHTPHGGSEKTDTERKVPGRASAKGLRVGVGRGSQSLRLIMCALHPP